MKCSNPNCRRSTSGPQEDPNKVVNIGVAAHITAASEGGPRFEQNMSTEERSSEANGIWLCQTCAKLIDNDPMHYPIDLLNRWRSLSEEAARLDIENPANGGRVKHVTDVDLIRFYTQCFDRPVFQDRFHQEMSMEAFDRAIEDTITAINTGCLRSRDGTVLSQSKGKSYLRHTDWRRGMDSIVDILRAIRSRYDHAVKTGTIHTHDLRDGDSFYDFRDPELADWMDQTRNQVLEIFGEVCREAGVPEPISLTQRRPRRFW